MSASATSSAHAAGAKINCVAHVGEQPPSPGDGHRQSPALTDREIWPLAAGPQLFALQHYWEGFALIAQHYMGSSDAAAVPGEFRTFANLIWELPRGIAESWLAELRRSWGELEASGGTLLLARLEKLY
jgi:hypothetical protein